MEIRNLIYISMKKILLYILLIHSTSIIAEAELVYKYITNEDGLSNSSVNKVFQDSEGYLWFGTWDGLNKYDGINFTTYNSNPNDTNSITNNVIKDIIEQHPGVIWVVTNHGINKINTKKETIDRYYLGYEHISPSLENAYSITCSKSGLIICSTHEWGLAYYDEEQNDFVPITIPKFSTFDIKQIYADEDCRLWILKRSGALFKVDYHIKEQSFSVSNISEIKRSEKSGFYSISKANDRHLFLTTYNNKLYEINRLQNTLKKLPIQTEPSHSRGQLCNPILTEKGKLFLPYSFDGIDIYSQYGDSLMFEKNICAGTPSFDIYYSTQSILWIGSDGEGVIKVYPNAKLFHNINDSDLEIDFKGAVRCFYLDVNTLYTGTKGGGIICTSNFFNLEQQTAYRIDIGDNFVYSIQQGFGDDLFVGTDAKGLYVYNKQSGVVRSIASANANEQFSSIYAIFSDEKVGEIWLGTSGYGLVRLKVKFINGNYELLSVKKYMQDKFDRFSICNNIIYSIAKDGDNLWLATRGGGLCRFSILEERFSSWQNEPLDNTSISSNDLLSLSIDKFHTLWIGTSYGLNALKLDNIQEGFQRYTMDNGLSNNTIHGIIPFDGKLWLSTNKGLTLLDPLKKNVFNFNLNDGLQSDEFCDGAYYRNEQYDYIFMGGISGFNYFRPSDISMRNFVPAINIVDFNISNQKENIESYISKDNKNNYHLSLKWEQRFFSFDFIAIDYIDSKKCEYKYILEGFSQDWINNGTSPHSSFTNVPPGKYILKVMASNGDKIWNPHPFILEIDVMPPWWKTSFAFIGCNILFLLLVWIIYKIVKYRWTLRNEIQLQRIESQHLQVIHETKLRFFTNIAHEFNSCLTLIYGPSRKLMEYADNEYIKKYLNVIRMNADRMQHLINELMEFRKVETDHLSLNLENVNISEIISYVSDNFEELGEEKRIHLFTDISINLVWVTDRDALEKILFNIISNAFKFTPNNGQVTISTTSDNARLTISIANTGLGIPPERLNDIFDRFKILDNIETQSLQGKLKQTGVGMALTKSLITALGGTIEVSSVENQLTTFTIVLPIREMVVQPQCTAESDELIPVTIKHGVSDNNAKATILVVEDNADMRDFIKDILADNYNVIEATNGEEGLEILKSQRPTLILADIIMPVMNGITFVKEVKSNLITNHIPVIILSSRIEIEDKARGYDSGIDAYVSKPFSPQYLLSVVNQILNIRSDLKHYYTSGLSKIDLHEGVIINENDKDFIISITKLIEDNIENENLSPLFICDNMALSRMQFYRKIKALTGQSPSEFIRNIKLKSAVNLLTSSQFTVQEIMYMTGFNSKSYFYREFTSMFGISPKEYRNQNTISTNSSSFK